MKKESIIKDLLFTVVGFGIGILTCLIWISHESYLDFLNRNSGAIQAISIFILVIITGFYVIKTHELAKTAEESLKFEMEKFEMRQLNFYQGKKD